MADDVAMNFRKQRGRAPGGEAEPSSGGVSTLVLVVCAAALGFGAFAFASGSVSLPGAPRIAALWQAPAPVARAATADEGPRVMSLVPGVRESVTTTTGMPLVGTSAVAVSYTPVGPVVLRKASGYVEIDGPRLLPPPIGPRRAGNGALDHAAKLANELRALAYTPCDSHLGTWPPPTSPSSSPDSCRRAPPSTRARPPTPPSGAGPRRASCAARSCRWPKRARSPPPTSASTPPPRREACSTAFPSAASPAADQTCTPLFAGITV
jgi:hypothetical protein